MPVEFLIQAGSSPSNQTVVVTVAVWSLSNDVESNNLLDVAWLSKSPSLIFAASGI